MPFHEDLLEQAQHLANREKKPRQASLRRAVSTAYYAFFHLLVYEATLNWKRADQRNLLARAFEHGKMKSASEREIAECNKHISARPTKLSRHELTYFKNLRDVASAFVQAQQQRHTADYDNSKQWARTDVDTQITIVKNAFACWKAIRKESRAGLFAFVTRRPQRMTRKERFQFAFFESTDLA